MAVLSNRPKENTVKTTVSFLTGALLAATITVSASAQFYQQSNLVSDVSGTAQVTDSHLVNSWGISMSATSPFWVSDAGSSVSTVYSVDPSTGAVTAIPLVVSVPLPSGQVHNAVNTDFILNGKPAAFIFASLNGSVYAWNGGGAASQMAIGTAPAAYTGIALGIFSGAQHLYAANPAANRIDVYDNTFSNVSASFTGKWIDTGLPAGLVPFNIANINGDLFVSYAPQNPTVVGLGVIDKYDTSGNLIARFATGDAATLPLYNPWGMTLAPASFGKFGNALLVGDFNLGISGTPPAAGPGYILAFDPAGNFLGTLKGTNGNPLNIDGLWGLVFGNGAFNSGSGIGGGSPDVLYFAAGIQNQRHGLFGSLTTCAGPVISHALANPNALWPPDNKFVPVAIDYDVTDGCDVTPPECSLSVTVSDSGGGIDNTADSFVVVNPHLVSLQAARNGGGGGRIYSVTITCTDQLPLSSNTTVTVTVAHDQGHRHEKRTEAGLHQREDAGK